MSALRIFIVTSLGISFGLCAWAMAAPWYIVLLTFGWVWMAAWEYTKEDD